MIQQSNINYIINVNIECKLIYLININYIYESNKLHLINIREVFSCI